MTASPDRGDAPPEPETRGPRSRAAAGGGERGPRDWIRLLAEEVGPRRPTGPGERRAAELILGRLRSAGLRAELEEFRGYSTFAAPYGAISAAAIAAGLLPRRRRVARSLLAGLSTAALVAEGGLVATPVSDALSRRRSQNVVATVEPRGEAERTLCVVCHLDTSRSGLLFHPGFVPHLNRWLAAQSIAGLVQGMEPLLAPSRGGRAMLAASRVLLAAGLGVMLEREIRGEDVPGANDNASGVAVIAEIALAVAKSPLERTRLVALFTGCEESGLLGAQSFLRSRDTSEWIFLNVDSVGGGTLRYGRQEGLLRRWDADPALISIAECLSRERPELGLEAAEGPIGLTYDATPVMARGGRAMTLVAGDGGVIPNYHWPTDTAENVDAGTVARALEATRAIVAAIDRGEAD